MSRLSCLDLLSVLDSFLSGHANFEQVRRFVFQFYEAEEDITLETDLELVFAALAPYLEWEEAHGDDIRRERMQRLRDALSAAGAPVERTVWALEFEQIKGLQRRLDGGAITRGTYEAQLCKLSPAEFDVGRVAFWAEAHRKLNEIDTALLT